MTTSVFFADGTEVLLDFEDLEKVQGFTWFNRLGYAARAIQKENGRWSSSLMHREIMNAPSGSLIDHINGNKLDNRKANLRICSQSENLMNRGAQRNNKSGFKGVSKFKGSQKWRATIVVNRKQKHLGLFDTALEASQAYDRAAIELHGAFAKINH